MRFDDSNRPEPTVSATSLKRLAFAAMIAAVAAALSGCAAQQRPLSFDERVWFDKAVGYDILPYPQRPAPLAPYEPLPYEPR
jgi:hypothetical protein